MSRHSAVAASGENHSAEALHEDLRRYTNSNGSSLFAQQRQQQQQQQQQHHHWSENVFLSSSTDTNTHGGSGTAGAPTATATTTNSYNLLDALALQQRLEEANRDLMMKGANSRTVCATSFSDFVSANANTTSLAGNNFNFNGAQIGSNNNDGNNVHAHAHVPSSFQQTEALLAPHPLQRNDYAPSLGLSHTLTQLRTLQDQLVLEQQQRREREQQQQQQQQNEQLQQRYERLLQLRAQSRHSAAAVAGNVDNNNLNHNNNDDSNNNNGWSIEPTPINQTGMNVVEALPPSTFFHDNREILPELEDIMWPYNNASTVSAPATAPVSAGTVMPSTSDIIRMSAASASAIAAASSDYQQQQQHIAAATNMHISMNDNNVDLFSTPFQAHQYQDLWSRRNSMEQLGSMSMPSAAAAAWPQPNSSSTFRDETKEFLITTLDDCENTLQNMDATLLGNIEDGTTASWLVNNRRASQITMAGTASTDAVAFKTDPPAKKSPTTMSCGPTQSDQWNEKYQELVKFRRKFGHCHVPNSNTEEGKPLAHWVRRQRHQYRRKVEGKHSTLSEDRHRALEDLDFVWDSHAAVWEERFEELLTFRAKYGHAKVPRRYPPNPQLAIWVKCQRRQYQLNKAGERTALTSDRTERLSGLGFVWYARGNRGHLIQPEPSSNKRRSGQQAIRNAATIAVSSVSAPTQHSFGGPSIGSI